MSAPIDPAAAGAVISPCGTYRYRLWRRWGDGPVCAFVMLNPSTADAAQDDPTIRKCIGFARRWGHGALEVVNLFAYRATRPGDLRAAARRGVDIHGCESLEHRTAVVSTASLVVAAWGANADWHGPMDTIADWLATFGDVWCLGRCRSGAPNHPLMLGYATPRELYRARVG